MRCPECGKTGSQLDPRFTANQFRFGAHVRVVYGGEGVVVRTGCLVRLKGEDDVKWYQTDALEYIKPEQVSLGVVAEQAFPIDVDAPDLFWEGAAQAVREEVLVREWKNPWVEQAWDILEELEQWNLDPVIHKRIKRLVGELSVPED